ncbi:MAG: hypothetical protein ACE5HE_15220, partial [Phycisphaerae bacterium]
DVVLGPTDNFTVLMRRLPCTAAARGASRRRRLVAPHTDIIGGFAYRFYAKLSSMALGHILGVTGSWG